MVASPLGAQSREVLSLERALEIGLSHSRSLADAKLGLRVAGQQVREAWGSVLPDISANASYSRNVKVQQAFLPAVIFDPTASPDELIPVRFGSDNTWQAGLSLEQPLFQYTAFIGVGAAGRYRDYQRERVRGVAQDVGTTVRVAYLDALLAAEDVRLTEQSVARVRRTLDETRAMNSAGLASDYDVLRLEVQLANLEPNLRRAENAVAATKRALLVAIGRDPRAVDGIELEGRLADVNVADVAQNAPINAQLLRQAGVDGAGSPAALEPEQAYQVALEARSDVRQARLTVQLERARLAAQRAEYFPKLTLFSNYSITAQENGAPDFFGTSRQRASFAVAGVRVELPIFNGFAREARVQQAGGTAAQAQTRLEQLEHEAAREVHTLTADVREARLRVDSQRRAVDQAQRGYEIASAEYRAGLGSQLQITDAEVALRQSEFNHARAVYDYLVASARLAAAVGTVPSGDVALR
ncbi:MAG: TolC family protein [Gemmatimonadetes bacterium]|nr:TolC family protein [Gemmatimonadota bacterium]MBI2535924.1 TolC family protein [Gemmatimonadota bacterium]